MKKTIVLTILFSICIILLFFFSPNGYAAPPSDNSVSIRTQSLRAASFPDLSPFTNKTRSGYLGRNNMIIDFTVSAANFNYHRANDRSYLKYRGYGQCVKSRCSTGCRYQSRISGSFYSIRT